MNITTLFLAWQDKNRRQWFPVGRLDADVNLPLYRFRYIAGVERAQREAKFPLLYEFPEMDRDYKSTELFALFKNRIIAPGRPDRRDYLHNLNLPENADPVEILSVSGGRRATDFYEVFPKIEKDDKGGFTCRFFLHGWRYVSEHAQERIENLKPGEELYLTLELSNPATGLAVQIQTQDYQMIGWAPRYLLGDLMAAMADFKNYSAHVVQVNPQPAPSRQRILVEMSGRWSEHEPMSGEDFDPLVRDSRDLRAA